MLIYDGECSWCAASVDWIEMRWPVGDRPAVVASQHLTVVQLTELGLSRDLVQRSAWWVDGDRLSEGHLAVADALVRCEGWWGSFGALLRKAPFRWAGSAVYPLIARLRGVVGSPPRSRRT